MADSPTALMLKETLWWNLVRLNIQKFNSGCDTPVV